MDRLGTTLRVVATLALASGICLAAQGESGPALAQSASCPGSPSADGIPQRAGGPLRFGITPGVQTGQLGTGPVPPRTPEDPGRQIAALGELAPGGAPFVLRLHRFFWSDGEAAIQRFLDLTQRYTSRGFLVELQLRYHPNTIQEGDIAGWTAFVREVVDRFGANPRVVAIQVTNEVNLAISPDSSDGSFRGGRDALIEGVVAAKDEARRRGFGALAIGFNWAYRAPPQDDDAFWRYLRDHGGGRFLAALDWIGLDAYPGSFFPPVEAPGRERDGMVNALSSLRCYAQSAGIPDAVPMHIEENGFPTAPSPDRSYARQAQALDTLVHTVNDFRGTYNVSDYRWFDLRDSDSTSPNFQQQYGLMTDAYVEKPAFGVYRRLIAEFTARSGGPPPPRASTPGRSGPRSRVVLSLRCTAGGGIRVRVAGPGAARVVSARVLLAGRQLFSGVRAPLNTILREPRHRRRSPRPALVVYLAGGERLIARGPARNCSVRRPRPRFAG